MKVPAEDEAFFRQALLSATSNDLSLPTEWEFEEIYQFHHYRNNSRGFEGLLFVARKDDDGEVYVDFFFRTDDYSSHNRLNRYGQLTRLENFEGQWGRPVYEDEEETKREHERIQKHNDEVARILNAKGFDDTRWSVSVPKKLTIAQQKDRWTTDWQPHAVMLMSLLQSRKSLSESNWPYTINGKLDLRGYTVPKDPLTQLGPRFQKLKFIHVDFSNSEWEGTEFLDCHFEDCNFDSARLFDARFHGCTFNALHFNRTNFGAASFSTSMAFFSRRKLNFKDVSFEKCNLSRVLVSGQGMENCTIKDCKTGGLTFHQCKLDNITFSGVIHNLDLDENKARQVDLRDCVLRDVSFSRQPLDGFLLPEGDDYYIFRDLVEDEIAWLQSQPMTEEERKVFDTLAFVWTHDKKRERFASINFLDPEEQEAGKRLLQMLKNRS